MPVPAVAVDEALVAVEQNAEELHALDDSKSSVKKALS